MKKIFSVGVMCLFVLGVSQVYSQAAAPGIDQGTKIGNVIKAIIGTALPPVQQLLNAIWPKNPNGTDVERTNKAVLQAKLAKYQESLKLMLSKDRDIANALAEADAIKNFLVPTNKIQIFLQKINPLIGGTSLTTDNWSMAKEFWTEAKVQINKTRSIALNDASPFLKESLKKIAYTDKTDIDNISIEYFNRDLNYINAPNTDRLPKLREKISVLLDIYQQVPSLMATYFDCLKVDIINSQTEIKEAINRTGDNNIATKMAIDKSFEKIELMKKEIKIDINNIDKKVIKSQSKLK